MDRNGIWTIPNILTIGRISSTPGLLIAFLNESILNLLTMVCINWCRIEPKFENLKNVDLPKFGWGE